MTQTLQKHVFPVIRTAGVTGMLVSFDDRLSEPANRAALSFAAAVKAQGWDGIEDVSSSLISVCLNFDPLHLPHADLQAKLEQLLQSQDWYASDLPNGRRLWRIPAVFGTDLAPQLEEAATAAGMSADEAVASLTTARTRVQAIGFAPGQPYLGQLPEAWDIPRQSQLTKDIPQGALVVAIRQLVLFAVQAQTGWRQVGQTAVKLYQPRAADPFMLRPGDEVMFHAISREELQNMQTDPMGGATSEVLS